MKTLLTFLALFSCGSALAAEKLCVGSYGEFKGYELRISTSKQKLVVSSMPSNRGYIAFAGAYEASLRERRQPLGPLQLGFHGYEEGAFNELWMDNALLEPGTKGSLDITSHDEGDLETSFDCKDFK